MVKISVIIPVFNVENYLNDCLDSIVNQTLNDIEIICVNDGSTDGSLSILNEYAIEDNRFKVVSQKNSGCGAASNLAMRMAKGKYLYFMDSDDILELNALEDIYYYAEDNNVDFLMFQAVNYDDYKGTYYKTDIYSMNKIAIFMEDKLVVNYSDLNELIFDIPVCPWSKLFNHDFIKKISVKFLEGLIFEDNIFFWEVLFNAKRIAFYEKYLYVRRRHSNSVMGSKDQRYIDSIKINNLMIDVFKKYDVFDKYKDILYNRKINLIYTRFTEINDDFKEDFFKLFKEDVMNIVSEKLYDDYINVLDIRNKVILDSCLDSSSVDEFRYKMAYFDSKNSINRQNKIIKDLNNVNSSLKQDLADLTEINGKIKNKNILLNAEINDANLELNEFKEKFGVIHQENIDLNKNFEKTVQNNMVLKENLNEIKNSNIILKDRNFELMDVIKHLNNENFNLRSKLSSFSNLNQKMNKVIENNNLLKNELELYKKWMLSGFMIKVSVVIPVYNVEEFLKECLDSIVNQTLKEIEIICVNDGSTDSSLDILNYYAEHDDRFTIISQENGGHAVATNRGMELARGKYLYLMDSDDILELTALEETYNYAEEKNVDFVLFQSMNYVTDEDRYYKTEIYSMPKVAEFAGDKIFNYNDLGDLIFAIPVTPWSKLYKNEFIKRIGAKFPEGLVFDDNIFFWDVLFNAKRIAFYHKHLFIRRWYSYSSTTAGDLRFLDSIDINNLMIDKFKQYGEFEKHKSYLYNRKISMALNRFNGIKPEFREDYFNKLHEDFKQIVSNNLYDDFADNLDIRNRKIFDSCINSKTSKEFQYEVAFWDSQQSRKKQEYQIQNLNNTIKNERLKFNEIQSNFKNEIKDLRDENHLLYSNNTILKNQVDYYSSSASWKVTEPLRNLKKLSSSDVDMGKGVIEFSMFKSNFVEDELIRLCKVSLKDSKGNNVNIDFNRLNVIYDKSFMIPFNNLVKSTKFEECYEFPAFALGRGYHKICLNYGKLYSEKLSVFVKDNTNLFEDNVWLGSDYNHDTSGFDKFNVKSISSTDYWSDVGERSVEVICDGSSNYQALVTPSINVNVDDYVSASVTIFNPEGDVTVRLFESDKSSYEDVIVPASEQPNKVTINKSAISNKIQLLIISRSKQVFYADNFVIKVN